jgi:hypothetical protein
MKKMSEKDLGITAVRGAKSNISDLVVYGDGDTFTLLCKASSQEQGWMKSTKVCNVEGGCIVQVTTQQRNPDGSYALAEALTYVPNNHINTDVEPRKLEEIKWPVRLQNAVQCEQQNSVDDDYHKRYQYQEYLQVLIAIQTAGHDVHAEINETLAKLNKIIFQA